jgi:RNA polymerase sigma-70 factor (ECF subfamily)
MEALQVVPARQNDTELLEQIHRGQQGALAALYDRYAEMVYTVALRVLRHPTAAEELLEDLFGEMWRTPENLFALRGSLGAWLVLTARNRAIALLRRRSQPSNNVLSPLLSHDLANETERTVMAQRTSFAVGRLTREQRKIIEMAFYDGLTARELAEITGESVPSLKQKIADSLCAMREAVFV